MFVVNKKYQKSYDNAVSFLQDALANYPDKDMTWEELFTILPDSGKTFLVMYSAQRRGEKVEVARCASLPQALFAMSNATKKGLYVVKEGMGGEEIVSRRVIA